jgi:hypothetical protein
MGIRKNRPNHAYAGTRGLNDEETSLLKEIVVSLRKSGLSYEAIHTVLIIVDDSMYMRKLTEPQKPK